MRLYSLIICVIKKWKEFLQREIAYVFIYVYVAEILYLKMSLTDTDLGRMGHPG